MGQLLHGKWTEDQPFAPGPHHNELGTAEFPFDAERDAGRYHLYVSHACPYANRALIARTLKGLQSTIGVSVVNPVNTAEGWSFDPREYAREDDIGDKVLGKRLLHEVYAAADSDYTGRVTVPLLIDTRPGPHAKGGDGKVRIVSNESIEIVEIFNKIGRAGPDLSLNADAQKEALYHVNAFSSAVFGVGRATNQAEYDAANDKLYAIVEDLDARLARQRWLASNDAPTAVDVLAFPHVARFDPVCSVIFRITRARISDYANLSRWLRRFYQLDGVRDAVVLRHVVDGAFSETSLKRFTKPKDGAIIPSIPKLNWLDPVD